MLVLSRQKDETIIIGDDIEITVVDIRGDKVRLGISAPKSLSVHRKEVYEAIRRENREGTSFVALPDPQYRKHRRLNVRKFNRRCEKAWPVLQGMLEEWRRKAASNV